MNPHNPFNLPMPDSRATDRLRPEDYLPGAFPSGSQIEDDPDYKPGCQHPCHQAPCHIVIPQGKRLRHVCPGCGQETIIRGSQLFCGFAFRVVPGLQGVHLVNPPQ